MLYEVLLRGGSNDSKICVKVTLVIVDMYLVKATFVN